MTDLLTLSRDFLLDILEKAVGEVKTEPHFHYVLPAPYPQVFVSPEIGSLCIESRFAAHQGLGCLIERNFKNSNNHFCALHRFCELTLRPHHIYCLPF